MDLGHILEIILIGMLGWNLHETISTGKAVATMQGQLVDHGRRLDVLESRDGP